MKKIILIATALLSSVSLNSYSMEKRGEIQFIKNNVQIDKSPEKSSISLVSKRWKNAVKGQDIFIGDNIRTGLRSITQISYDDGTTTRIGSRSLVTVKDRTLNLKRGYLWGKVDKYKTKGLKIITSSAVAAIIGTEFFVEIDSGGFTTLTVLEGMVEFEGKKGNVKVTNGMYSVIDKDGNVGEPALFDKDLVIKRYSDVVIDI